MAKLGRLKGSKNKKRKKRAVSIPSYHNANIKDKQASTGKYDAFNPNGGDLGRGTVENQVEEVFRASPNSYVLIMGTRVPIQDLSHESLCDRYTLIQNETSNLRRELNALEELESNLRAEKFYRKL